MLATLPASYCEIDLIDDYRMRGYREHLCIFACVQGHISIYVHLCQIYCGLMVSKATTKPTNPVCFIQSMKNHQ